MHGAREDLAPCSWPSLALAAHASYLHLLFACSGLTIKDQKAKPLRTCHGHLPLPPHPHPAPDPISSYELVRARYSR